MAADAAFVRRLEQALIARLRAGQDPVALLQELQQRLTPEEAEQVLSRAEAQVAKKSRAGMPLSGRVLMGIVCVWIAILILQNVGVLFAIREIPPLPGDPGPSTWVAMTIFKMGLLVVALGMFWRSQTAVSTATLALAIVYAFPVGRFVEGWLGVGFGAQDPAILVSGSALPSYLAAALVVFVYRQARRVQPTPPAVEAFG